MTFHGDLVTQARRLATLDPKRPNQANLRRAVSSAYYALFHCLADDGAKRLSRAPAKSPLWQLVQRKYDHKAMKEISLAFVQAREWVGNATVSVPADLRSVADSFVYLQEERHDADYNLQDRFTRTRALEAVERAEIALTTWSRVRRAEEAKLYLLTMLLGAPRR